jgi:CRISPR-associated endonuclease Cas2
MSHTAGNVTLVCYDIASDRLRRRIEKCLKDFGTRLQFSVFMCRLDAGGAARCRASLQKVLDLHAVECMPNDSLIIFERFQPSIADSLLGARIEAVPAPFGII